MEIKKREIETKRLRLRPYNEGDVDQLVTLLTDEMITKTFMVPEFSSRDQAEELARKLVGFSQPEDVKHLEYGIALDGKVIGFINDCGFDEEEVEIGYVMHPDYQGKGYTTEAVKAIINELFEMGFKKVTAEFFEENIASRRVMEKCGMKLTDEVDEEEYRGVSHRCLCCEIHKN